jgi:signal transduction histidine kinase
VVASAIDGWIEVRDDGPGVSTAQSSLITRRFWRADWNRTDSAGLGLSIVQRIMDVHEGRFEQLENDRGAQFRLHFRTSVPSAG